MHHRKAPNRAGTERVRRRRRAGGAGAERPIVVAIAKLDVVRVRRELPICPASAGAHAVPRHHSRLCTRAQRGQRRWPPASYAAERPLCSRAPRTRHYVHCLCGVCVLAGSTHGFDLGAHNPRADAIIFSLVASGPCNHPIARHLSLGVRLPRALRGPSYRVRLRGMAGGGPARLAWPALACVCALASHVCRHQAVVSRREWERRLVTGSHPRTRAAIAGLRLHGAGRRSPPCSLPHLLARGVWTVQL